MKKRKQKKPTVKKPAPTWRIFIPYRLLAWIKKPSTSNWRLPAVPAYGALIAVLVVVVYVCAFKVLDRDFWWHITAGKIMLASHRLIQIDPFAYTRAGLPYLARYEWLSQIVLYVVYHLGGITGVIMFRTGMMVAVLLLLLRLSKQAPWLGAFFAILGATAMRPVFLERPQLFTFLIFTIWFLIILRVLERGWRKPDIIWAVLLQIIWVNTHGAASFLVGLFLGALFGQLWFDGFKSQPAQREKYVQAMRTTVWVGLGLAVATLISPNSYHNITYLSQLLTDRTIVFINEWQPRPWWQYLKDMTPFLIGAGLSLALNRKRWVFWGILLMATAYLSRQAVRHEIFLVITCLAAIYSLLPEQVWYQRTKAWFSARPKVALPAMGLIIGLVFFHTWISYRLFVQRDYLNGYGSFTPAKGAYDFIEKNNLQGPMFNTYGIGGYLMYRGYQTRPVYIDGRNVDYGFVFMSKTYLAGQDSEQWQKLEDKYRFSYAVVDYDAARPDGKPPGIPHLDTNPTWRLVYLDDWTAIYVKATAQNQSVIDRYAYKLVTPGALDADQFSGQADVKDLEKELRRVAAESGTGFKAHLSLANLYTKEKRFDDALREVNKAKAVQPDRAQVYSALASVYVAQNKSKDAAQAYSQTLWRAGNAFPDINYDYIADVFDKGGFPMRGAYYHFKAKFQRWWHAPLPGNQTPASTPPVSLPSFSPLPSSSPGANSMVDLGADLESFNKEAIAFAEKGEFDKARESFLNALKINPSSAQVLNNLGTLSLQQNKLDEAVDYYNRALIIAPTYGDSHYNLALIYFRQGKGKEAKQEALMAQKNGKDITVLLKAFSVTLP